MEKTFLTFPSFWWVIEVGCFAVDHGSGAARITLGCMPVGALSVTPTVLVSEMQQRITPGVSSAK
jgi:hypothetical protein